MTPKLQTSLSVENFLYMMLSGGIQRMGSMVCPPTCGEEWSGVEKPSLLALGEAQIGKHSHPRDYPQGVWGLNGPACNWYSQLYISWMSVLLAQSCKRWHSPPHTLALKILECFPYSSHGSRPFVEDVKSLLCGSCGPKPRSQGPVRDQRHDNRYYHHTLTKKQNKQTNIYIYIY